MTRAEAIYSYTMANAYAAFEDALKGSLEPGKYADLIILDRDLIRCDEKEILDAQVKLTIVNGDVKYRANDF
jgi:predicted amidohydrolase YtcJ